MTRHTLTCENHIVLSVDAADTQQNAAKVKQAQRELDALYEPSEDQIVRIVMDVHSFLSAKE